MKLIPFTRQLPPRPTPDRSKRRSVVRTTFGDHLSIGERDHVLEVGHLYTRPKLVPPVINHDIVQRGAMATLLDKTRHLPKYHDALFSKILKTDD